MGKLGEEISWFDRENLWSLEIVAINLFKSLNLSKWLFSCPYLWWCIYCKRAHLSALPPTTIWGECMGCVVRIDLAAPNRLRTGPSVMEVHWVILVGLSLSLSSTSSQGFWSDDKRKEDSDVSFLLLLPASSNPNNNPRAKLLEVTIDVLIKTFNYGCWETSAAFWSTPQIQIPGKAY